MSKKFMRIRKVIIPIMTLAVTLSQLAGCAMLNSSKLLDMYQNGETVVIEVASPSTYKVEEQGTIINAVDWIQLDQLKTYKTFRQDFDDVFNINIVSERGIDSKSGVLYVDKDNDRNGNTTLMDAFRNKKFIEKYWSKNETIQSLAKLISEVYDDLEDDSEHTRLLASLNAYYNLMNDFENPTSFNPTSTLERDEFMTLLLKATEPVKGLRKNDENVFSKNMGYESNKSEYLRYAGEMEDYSYLKADNKSLDQNTIDKSISRIEAVYMIVNKLLTTELEKVTGSDKSYSDLKNGGDLALSVGFKEKDKETDEIKTKDRWQAYTLAYSLENPKKGVDEDLYKPMVVAYNLGLLGDEEDSRWDEMISKEEALQLLINTFEAMNDIYGYQSDKEYGNLNLDKFKISSSDIFEDYKGYTTPSEEDGAVFGYDNFGHPITALDFEIWDLETVESLVESERFGNDILDKYKEYHNMNKEEKEKVVDEKLEEQYNNYEQNVLPTIPEEEKIKPGDMVEVNPGVEIPAGGGEAVEVLPPPPGWTTGDNNIDQVPPNGYDSVYDNYSQEQKDETDRIINSIG